MEKRRIPVIGGLVIASALTTIVVSVIVAFWFVSNRKATPLTTSTGQTSVSSSQQLVATQSVEIGVFRDRGASIKAQPIGSRPKQFLTERQVLEMQEKQKAKQRVSSSQ